MIKLQVEKYCQECPDFKAKVSLENISFANMTPYVCGDTVVSCKYAQRCKNIYERIRNHKQPSLDYFELMTNMINLSKDDTEACHKGMDDLLCNLLVELGYEDVVQLFRKTEKWYA